VRAFSYSRSLPVMWKRCRSHYSLRRSQKTCYARKRHGSMFYRTVVIVDCSFTLLLWPWPWADDPHIRTWLVFREDVP